MALSRVGFQKRNSQEQRADWPFVVVADVDIDAVLAAAAVARMEVLVIAVAVAVAVVVMIVRKRIVQRLHVVGRKFHGISLHASCAPRQTWRMACLH